MAFSKPASTSGIQFDDLKGALLFIEPLKQEYAIPTAYGDNDAVRAHVSVLDGPLSGTEYLDTLIFPRVLQNQIKQAIGKKDLERFVVGRLGQGEKKSGQSAPWKLLDMTGDDEAVASKYADATGKSAPSPTFSSPVEPPF